MSHGDGEIEDCMETPLISACQMDMNRCKRFPDGQGWRLHFCKATYAQVLLSE